MCCFYIWKFFWKTFFVVLLRRFVFICSERTVFFLGYSEVQMTLLFISIINYINIRIELHFILLYCVHNLNEWIQKQYDKFQLSIYLILDKLCSVMKLCDAFSLIIVQIYIIYLVIYLLGKWSLCLSISLQPKEHLLAHFWENFPHCRLSN